MVRPTLIDSFRASPRTFTMVRRLGKPATVVVNQAPTARDGVEPPLVKRALRGLGIHAGPGRPW